MKEKNASVSILIEVMQILTISIFQQVIVQILIVLMLILFAVTA